MSTYLIDDYVATKPGDPYRLFPFGVLIKNGVKRLITPEIAARFKLPHFKPPMKLGSHDEKTAAGGHIVGLEVREDGLYAVPELTDKGAMAIEQGDYRYHSPEVIWDGGGFEDPTTGELIEGPLIVGDALLHTPHLGEAAALYSVQEVKQMDDMIQVPKTFWDTVLDVFRAKPQPEPQPEQEPEAQVDYSAMIAERDNLAAELATLKAEQNKQARIDAFAAQLAETKVVEGADMIATMTDEQAEWVMQQFRALSAQINESAITGEIGSEGEGKPENPVEALNVAILARMDAEKVDYATAVAKIAAEQPDLVRAAGYK